MSLIQDALKRQQEESESSRVPLKAAAAPSVPDTMPLPPRPEPANPPLPETSLANPMKSEQSGKSWKRIAGIIIFCILIVWGGGLLVTFVMKQSVQRTLDTLIPGLTTGRIVLSNKPAAQAPLSPAHPSAAAMPKPVVTPTPVRSSAPTPIPWISPAAATATAFADEGEDVAENVALPSVNKQKLPVPVPSPVPVVWPRLKLSAIFSNVASGRAGARLNNRLILLGDQIEGVTLVEIRRDSVVLKCGAEIRFLKMGMTLN